MLWRCSCVRAVDRSSTAGGAARRGSSGASCRCGTTPAYGVLGSTGLDTRAAPYGTSDAAATAGTTVVGSGGSASSDGRGAPAGDGTTATGMVGTAGGAASGAPGWGPVAGPGTGATVEPHSFSRTPRARSLTSGSVASGGSSSAPTRNSACWSARASCRFSLSSARATSGARSTRRCISPRSWSTCRGVSVSMSRAISARSAALAAATRACSAASCSRRRASLSATVGSGIGSATAGPATDPVTLGRPVGLSSASLFRGACSSLSAQSMRSLRPLYSTLLSFSMADCTEPGSEKSQNA
mmetsp:Transcript_497/g.1675  ORF Transcript_497/g.1675 Transcript_497/m.1675 type:complete len:299 (+) Transcript_497:189-1085(+)